MNSLYCLIRPCDDLGGYGLFIVWVWVGWQGRALLHETSMGWAGPECSAAAELGVFAWAGLQAVAALGGVAPVPPSRHTCRRNGTEQKGNRMATHLQAVGVGKLLSVGLEVQGDAGASRDVAALLLADCAGGVGGTGGTGGVVGGRGG